jgi:hypothetical protein
LILHVAIIRLPCVHEMINEEVLKSLDGQIKINVDPLCRLQWPRRLRHELSSLAPTLGSWVEIPLKAWVSVCVYSVSVLFCVGSGLTTG